MNHPPKKPLLDVHHRDLRKHSGLILTDSTASREFLRNRARLLGEAKLGILRSQVETMVEHGYRVEEMVLVEQAHPSMNPELDTIRVLLHPEAELIIGPVLALRRWWRRNVRPYEYAVSSIRESSRVSDGKQGS